ncbi:MAG: thioredoxin domain-containing protein [gamma proteobacterium symbiont of Bathyaustriella thionipta]|nr:thioredoxin domain-containing protein [gamma proteobacterium symbiont of Bathyaustriella thionipta]MCU7951278.1 thioredoxin domain-containing protein [gamma proteobacterium symbiont of Bathyaustriella thionipta]MCU7954966.1 thioredoxin domain-containing protein [gamma proteobacterium symbiont of Bathyaustriella thionipta]MCU7957811.1 thioredoxin domain-containing protein [gamma proteobacterium symbiont of Bathyaustriella thionipta]MCU7969015.1 thioredoxin domain-containing protein [gamma pro
MMKYTNKLSNETSPYLQQHAHNPVEWYPWNQESLDKAKKENKPILLSIGYSACHWCHVMAHESFENEAIAEIMNDHFINIKVDREERPDLDKIYQTSHQLMLNRPGGWPLTLFLSPEDQLPFYAGTYFPAEARYQMPAFPELLKQLSDYYHTNQEKVRASKNALKQALKDYEEPHNNDQEEINAVPFNRFRGEVKQAYDSLNGGFGKAPKFPHLSILESLMRYQYLAAQQNHEDTDGLEMLLYSLKKMASGGIYDQLGGGICRYSVDDYWMIPHFEKMLYDNGPLLSVYCDAWQLSKETSKGCDEAYSVLFKRTIEETADWVIREMQSPEGGFYSTLDADTEGQEGKFYVWNRDEVKQILQSDEPLYPILAAHYGLDRNSNFEGAWNLHIYKERDELAEQFSLSTEGFDSLLDKARMRLFEQREQRIKPGRDEKILTSWNALMIKGLAKAGRLFQSSDNQSVYIEAAERSVEFIRQTLWVDNRLLATYKDGQARLSAYLDDYAFLLDALIELLQTRWKTEDMNFAIQLADVLLLEFEDKDNGGFFFTANHHESLISRTKSFSDESIPSGNAVAAFALGRLGHILGNTQYIHAAERTIRAAWPRLKQMPYGHASLLLALEDMLFPPQIIVLRGSKKVLNGWQTICQNRYAPKQLCLAIDNSCKDLPEGLSERRAQGDGVAYICSGFQCSTPISSSSELISKMSQ